MVKIVTDNSSDIPAKIAQELGIAVIPLYVNFGEKTYREGLDIDVDGFYHELMHNPNPPKTSTPSPGDFIQLYEQLATETGAIVSILDSRTRQRLLHQLWQQVMKQATTDE